jgi:hypothetical protein
MELTQRVCLDGFAINKLLEPAMLFRSLTLATSFLAMTAAVRADDRDAVARAFHVDAQRLRRLPEDKRTRFARRLV